MKTVSPWTATSWRIFDADSLDVVDMVMSLEDEFGIEVPDEEVEKLHTVGDVVRFIDANT